MRTRRPRTGRHPLRSPLLAIAVLSASGVSAPGWTKNADDVPNQTAMAIPRIGMPGARSVALPQPLSVQDVIRVKGILAQQRAGAITEANLAMDHLESDILRGAILADRYLDTAYLPEAAELSAWLVHFGDQPDAPAILAMLETLGQQPGGQQPGVQQPGGQQSGRPPRAAANVSRANPRPGQKVAVGVPARTFLVQNDDRGAIEAARASLARGRDASAAPESLLAGGVAAWRLSDLTTAKPLFEAAWHGAESPSLRAAAAFWTARVAERTHDRGSRIFWLRRAGREADTFYGPIARHALNPVVPCLPSSPTSRPVVTNADVEALMATAPGRRSFALLQVGERQRAEAELRALWFDSGPVSALGHSLILVANAVGLEQFAGEMRDDFEIAEAAPGKFELPMLRPAGGFHMDPAFVYAVVRHESNFLPLAVSPVGARGLMQVMPATAVGLGAISEGQADRLNDPSTNLAAGQRYLLQLSDNPLVADDLLKLIAAYGQGPTGMNRWAEGIRDDHDPFVFLEAIPSPFMRQFVEDVLVFHWQYAAALRVRASSLDDLAAGIYPRFAPIKAAPGGIQARPEACPAPAFKG